MMSRRLEAMIGNRVIFDRRQRVIDNARKIRVRAEHDLKERQRTVFAAFIERGNKLDIIDTIDIINHCNWYRDGIQQYKIVEED